MAALVCDICGGKLVVQSGGVAKCDSCGMEYTKERIQEKVQEIKGTVKIDGPVETVKGNAEKERLINNAQHMYEIGNYKKCFDLYKEISEQFPDDYRVWIGIAKSSIATKKSIGFFDITFLVEGNVSNALKFFNKSSIYHDYSRIYADIIGRINKGIQYINLNSIDELLEYDYALENSVFIDFLKEYYDRCCNNASLLKTSISHAYKISNAGVIPSSDDTLLCGYIEDLIALSEYDALTSKPKTNSNGYCYYSEWNYKKSIKDIISCAEKKDQGLTWKDNGLCIYCGGSFSFWTGKCKNCGKSR